MVSAARLRLGGAYVELVADRARLQADLAGARQDLARFGAESKGVFKGSFKGADLFETGLRVTTVLTAAKVAMADLQIFSALFRGDMQAAEKAVLQLPFGMGQVSKTLGDLIASGVGALGGWTAPRGETAQEKDLWKRQAAGARQYRSDLEAAQKALARVTLSSREYAAAEVAAMGLTREAAAKLLDVKLRTIAAEERKAAATTREREGRAAVLKEWEAAGAVYAEAEREITRLRESIDGLVMGEAAAAEKTALARGMSQHQAAAIRGLTEEYERLTEAKREAERTFREMEAEGETAAREWLGDIERGVEDRVSAGDKLRDELTRAQVEAGTKPGIERDLATVQLERVKAIRDATEAGHEDLLGDIDRLYNLKAQIVRVAGMTEDVPVRGMMGGVGAELMTAGGVDDRSTRAAEATARDVKRLVELAQAGKLVFAQ